MCEEFGFFKKAHLAELCWVTKVNEHIFCHKVISSKWSLFNVVISQTYTVHYMIQHDLFPVLRLFLYLDFLNESLLVKFAIRRYFH